MRILLLLLVFVPTISFGQVAPDESLIKDILIEGNVSDVNGIPLTGVAISEKGKSGVIKTNFDGNFNLKAKEGAVLIVNCSGFKTKEIAVGNQTKIDITLEDDGKSESNRPLTKAEIRKNKREARKAKYSKYSNPEPLDLKEELLKATGRSIKGAIRKKENN